ncbi:MAG: hypothetical protein HUU55_14745 [Myxococcales bacterium]|nr:hypothetical protein [Myxococcales bacterium]
MVACSTLVMVMIRKTVGLIQLMALLSLLCGTGLAQESGKVTDADCGAMWLDGATARVRVDVRSGLFPRKDATVRAELSQEAAAIGGAGLPRAAVFRCLPGKDGSEPKMTAVSSIISLGDNGRPELAWTVGAAMGALAQQRYHIYLAPPTNPPMRIGEAYSGPPVRLPGENLVENASFEELDEVEPNSPRGFYLSGSDSTGSYSATGERQFLARRSGSAGFRAAVSGSGTAEPPSVRATQADPVPVVPGVRYNIAVWANIRSASYVGLSAVAPFLDADGNDLPARIVVESAPGQTTRGFELFQGWAVAPPDAHFVRLTLGTWKSVGETWVDDVGLFADPTGLSPPPDVETHGLETQPQPRKNLRLSAGGAALLFDLGPPDSMVAGGFLPLGPDARISENNSAGFEEGDKPVAAGGQRPDVLAQDHLDIGGTTLSVRVPNGKVAVWMLMGDYRAPGPGEWKPSELYRQSVTVHAENETKMTVDRRLDFRSLHLEPEDDAVVFLQRKSAAMWERYVNPRFVDVIFETEVKDGLLQLRCEPRGACPVAALAVFPSGTVDDVQQVVADYAKRRRHSFTVSWAMPYEPPTTTEALIATTAEQQRGFVAFLPSSDTDVFPHTAPTRADVNRAAEGLRIRVTPGETRGALVGLYPLVFRRGATIAVEPPQTRVGETLGEKAVVLYGVRYRAQRLSIQGGDPRFALRPLELVETKEADIRPGLTRSFWLSVQCPGHAQAGTYSGSITVDAGRERSLTLPLTVEVLPFVLPESPMMQGIGYKPFVAGQPVVDVLRDLGQMGMNVIELANDPVVTSTQGVITMDFMSWEDQLAAAKTAGMAVNATVARGLATAALKPLGIAGITAPAGRVPSAVKLKPEEERVWVDLVTRGKAVVAAAGVSSPIVVIDPLEFPGVMDPRGLVEILLAACRKGGGVCTAPVSAWGNGGETWANSAQPLFIYGGTKTFTPSPVGGKSKKRTQPQQWLYDAGGSRLGRGFLPWALGAQGVFEGVYATTEGAGDPFDDWDSDLRTATYGVVGPLGRIPYLRWERTRMGLMDARYIQALELLIGEAKKRKKAAITKEAENLLIQIRDQANNALPTLIVNWDFATVSSAFGFSAKMDDWHHRCVDQIQWLREQLK